jgi:hypothetical protein
MLCNESLRTSFDVRVAAAAVQKPSSTCHTARGHCVASLILLGCALACAFGCNDARETERAEARTLLAHLNALNDRHSLQQQKAALDTLQRLALHVASHVRARDACQRAHEGLLEAETAQASARLAWRAASAGPATNSAISPQTAQAIGADIARSNSALADAKARFPACERATRELLTRAR